MLDDLKEALIAVEQYETTPADEGWENAAFDAIAFIRRHGRALEKMLSEPAGCIYRDDLERLRFGVIEMFPPENDEESIPVYMLPEEK